MCLQQNLKGKKKRKQTFVVGRKRGTETGQWMWIVLCDGNISHTAIMLGMESIRGGRGWLAHAVFLILCFSQRLDPSVHSV